MKTREAKRWLRDTGGMLLGWALVGAGAILLVLPGPGLLVMATGMALLAPHYAWAHRIVDPLKKRAISGAKRSVRSPRHIATSAAGALWLLGLGAIWLVGPRVPTFQVWGLEFGPRPPGGRAAGLGMAVSGAAAVLLLIYSIRRWYPGDSHHQDR